MYLDQDLKKNYSTKVAPFNTIVALIPITIYIQRIFQLT